MSFHIPKSIKIIASVVLGVIVIIFILAFVPQVTRIFVHDIPPIDDSDLRLAPIVVADNENGYFDLVKSGKEMQYPPKTDTNSDVVEDALSGKTWDGNAIAEIISKNSQALDDFAIAAKKPKFQDPAMADPSKVTFSTILPSLTNWRKIARLSALDALYLAKQGKDKEAMAAAMAPVLLAQKMEGSYVDLIEYLVTIEIKKTGLDASRQILVSSTFNNTELSQYSSELKSEEVDKRGLVTAFLVEYPNMLDIIKNFYAISSNGAGTEPENGFLFNNFSALPHGAQVFYFQPNKTKLLFANGVRKEVERANEQCGKLVVPAMKPQSPLQKLLSSNSVGETMKDFFRLDMITVFQKRCQASFSTSATKTLLAIKAFKNDTGNYPQLLDQLVPKYLSSVPVDPYDGKSLKYSVEKKIVYSVGEDGIDSGGSTGDDWKAMPDPTFSINF